MNISIKRFAATGTQADKIRMVRKTNNLDSLKNCNKTSCEFDGA